MLQGVNNLELSTVDFISLAQMIQQYLVHN